jgi:TRAP-type mannitol/chloroaromatic compound transport system permease small subunit
MFIYFGAEKAVDAMEFGEKAVGTPWLEIWPYRFVIVVGMVGLLLQALAQLLRAITVKEFKPTDEDETAIAIEAEETVFEELELDPALDGRPTAAGQEPATTGKVETR